MPTAEITNEAGIEAVHLWRRYNFRDLAGPESSKSWIKPIWPTNYAKLWDLGSPMSTSRPLTVAVYLALLD